MVENGPKNCKFSCCDFFLNLSIHFAEIRIQENMLEKNDCDSAKFESMPFVVVYDFLS